MYPSSYRVRFSHTSKLTERIINILSPNRQWISTVYTQYVHRCGMYMPIDIPTRQLAGKFSSIHISKSPKSMFNLCILLSTRWRYVLKTHLILAYIITIVVHLSFLTLLSRTRLNFFDVAFEYLTFLPRVHVSPLFKASLFNIPKSLCQLFQLIIFFNSQ